MATNIVFRTGNGVPMVVPVKLQNLQGSPKGVNFKQACPDCEGYVGRKNVCKDCDKELESSEILNFFSLS